MKKLILFLFFCSLFIVEGYANPHSAISKKPRIYLCARLSEEARQWNNEVTNVLTSDFTLFRPQDLDLRGCPESHIDWVAYLADFRGMFDCDLLLVLPPYGRDCAWEIGWFCAQGRPTIAYTEGKDEWLRDAMVKGGLTGVITNDKELHQRLLADPSTCSKSRLISAREELAAALKNYLHHR